MGSGGNVGITANSLEVTNRSNLSASTLGIRDAGDVVIEVRDLVVFDNGVASSNVGSQARGNGGNVEIRTNSLRASNGSQLQVSTFGTGNAGNVIITAQDRVIFDGVNANSGIISGVGSTVESGAQGVGGNVVIAANSLEVTNGAGLLASTSGIGNAGNVVVAANTLNVTNGAYLSTNTSAIGNAGDVIIDSQGHVVFNDGFVLSNVVDGAFGRGGNVLVAANTLDIINGAVVLSSTSGTGDAGNVIITSTGRVNLQGFGISGLPSGILTNNTVFSTGQSSDISIITPFLQVWDGAILFASTSNAQPGGDIALSVDRIEVLSGGQIVAGSEGMGSAGTIRIDAAESILISGNDSIFDARAAQVPEFALLFSPRSTVSVRSGAQGAAGNVVIGGLGSTPRLELNSGGRLIAESASVDGGNIVINLNELLLLRNGSLISTTAGTSQAGGNGGNITITVPFIVAIPAENSDITADAFEGSGGNVNITARGIFGIEPRSERTPLSDITASSELGFSGVVTLNTLDTSVIENSLTSLADTIIDIAALTAGSCIARSDESLGSFAITGSGGLPQRPGDSGISSYPTGTVRTAAESTTALQEPDGVYQLPDGRLVLSRACE
jgi:large exoprotein involved in heme utilization and adhesion